jgi:hypothetical protein
MLRSLVAAASLMTVAGAAQAAAPRAALQGFWEPPQEGGVKLVEPPVLTEKGKQAAQDLRKATDMKDGVALGSRYCLPLSQPWNLMQSAPIDIIQDERETTMLFEQHSVPTHIYTDGRDHTAAARMKLQSNGHSTGRWDGDTFVVDSIRFASNGFAAGDSLPGGVPKSPTTHVVARFTPSADGNTLRARFTADDPELLAKPYSWDFTWKRSDPAAYAVVAECDPRNLANSKY